MSFLVFDDDDGDVLTVQEPTLASVVVSAETGQDILVITTSGPPGATGSPGADGIIGTDGEQGPAGATGATGTATWLTFGFAVPVNTWVINHDLGSFNIDVKLFAVNGDEMVGEVVHVSNMSIEVRWWYPMAGTARLLY